MNVEAKLYFLLGVAKVGLDEARKLSPSKKTDDELKARAEEIKNLTTTAIDIDKVYREFFFYSPVIRPETSVSEGTIGKG